jgi:dienelactone hydrolase
VERAARWLLSRADITPGTVAAMGMSRGSELALWAGVLLDVIGAVVAFAPSGISWPGLNADGPAAAPAWTFRGRPLPHATVGDAAETALAPSSGPPVALRAIFEPTLANAALFEHAVIPVEEIRGPVMFVSGEADTMWPATQMTQIAEQRARDRGFRYPLVHLRYRDGGHVCAGVPGTPVATEVKHHPLTGGRYSFGGTRAGNAAARADSWPRVVAFLRDGAPGKRTAPPESERGQPMPLTAPTALPQLPRPTVAELTRQISARRSKAIRESQNRTSYSAKSAWKSATRGSWATSAWR